METENKKKNDWAKYLIVLVLTLGLFAVAAGLSNFFTNKKVDDMRATQDTLETDILSSETEFSLLSELSCQQDDGSEDLSNELSDMEQKIQYSEDNFKDNASVIQLKRYYTILEIKDYILTKQINQRCGQTRIPILYFYTTADNCTECTKQGFALTELREKYPDLRVYSFDYNIDLSALTALLKIYKIDDKDLPAIVIDDDKYTGFQSVESIEKAYPDIIKLLPKADPTATKS